MLHANMEHIFNVIGHHAHKILCIIFFKISVINQTMNLVKKNTTDDPQTDSNALLDYPVCFLKVIKN